MAIICVACSLTHKKYIYKGTKPGMCSDEHYDPDCFDTLKKRYKEKIKEFVDKE